MIVIHAFWEIDIGLHLWGESAATLDDASNSIKEQKKPGTHPFALAHSQLQDVIRNISAKSFSDNTAPGTLIALLPSTESLPNASKDLLASGFGDAGKTTDKIGRVPWRIDSKATDKPLMFRNEQLLEGCERSR